MMKILRFLFLFLSFTVNAQKNDLRKYSCNNLKSILESKIVIDLFFLNKIKDSITVVDTFHVFQCNELRILNKPTKITDKYISELAGGPDNSYRKLKDRAGRIIVLQQVQIVNNKCLLQFWQPQDNATFEVSINRRGKLKFGKIGIY